ncbi:amidase [Acidiphilium acidophilum]|uniref:amidase n=1 Tax=Acidiphilium acidophilum TaxID=76588 RepID=UPI002E8E73B3|nr:amidase [Acidiphilium acidophilum]
MSTQDAEGGLIARLNLEGAEGGPLAGLDVVVKDVFDIEGTVTSFGNPDWARRHEPASSDAAVVARLRDAGARITGKTVTVEFTFGLEGHNHWYGTPRNPAAVDHLPGGSSSGSASAVAAGIASVGLGSDTGGSVRIPASYCGLFGIRPSFGAISLAGAARYVPSLDVAGWFARDPCTLRGVGRALLTGGAPLGGPVLLVRDAFDNAESPVAAALASACDAIARTGRGMVDVRLYPNGLDHLFTAQYTIHGREAWQSLGPWIEAVGPVMAEETSSRFRAASRIGAAETRAARAAAETFRARIRALLAGGGVLAFPTSPCPAPRRDADRATLEAVRHATQRVTAIAGLAGLAEITLPTSLCNGLPVGLSLAAAPGCDHALLDLACDIWRETHYDPAYQAGDSHLDFGGLSR